MQILAIISQKGGAGKTTLAVNLAVAAEREDTPTVIIDLDPQASAKIRLQAIPSFLIWAADSTRITCT